jgi:imidazolonepropionase-like amidohydrolase
MPVKSAIAGLLAVCLALGGCERRPLVTRDARASRTFCLRNVRVFDAPRAAVLEGLRDVLVREGRIAAISLAGMKVSGADAIDGRGATLLPGLVDLHVHAGASSAPPWKLGMPRPQDNFEAFLYAGVTTVLDLGNFSPDVFRTRERIRRGEILAPHLYAAGPIFTAPDSHPVGLLRLALPWWLRWYVIPRFTRQVATAAEARRSVDALLDDRPDLLKIAIDRIPLDSPRISRELIAEIAAEGHEHGLRSIAHVGRSIDVVDAVAGGVDALAHIVYPEEISVEAVEAVAARHVPVVATISVFDSQERFLLDDRPPYTDLELQVAPPEIVEALRVVPASFDRKPIEPVVRSLIDGHEARRKNVAKLRRAGVTILAGSDAPNIGHFPGASMHLELRDLVEAGMTPGEALRAATSDAARFLAGETADFGDVSTGKRADFLLVDGDPLRDITAVSRIRDVFLDGSRLERLPRNGRPD